MRVFLSKLAFGGILYISMKFIDCEEARNACAPE